jgi:hypothetical protein
MLMRLVLALVWRQLRQRLWLGKLCLMRRQPWSGTPWNDYIQHTIVEVLIEVLRRGEAAVAYGTLGASDTLQTRAVDAAGAAIGTGQGWPTTVGWRLLDVVHGGQMSLEDVGSVKGLLVGGAGPGAEWTDHGAFVMRERVTVLVILASKTLCVILARLDGALLWSFLLMCQHMRI